MINRITFKNILEFILILLFLGVELHAQGGKISGKIVDSKTNEPLPGVNVIIENLNIGAATDIEGDYFILNVPPGTFEVRASLIGYKTTIQTNVSVSSNHTTNLNFNLDETVLQIGEDVVVIAQRPPVLKDETSTRHFVSANEIASRPATQLMEILTTLPGIDVNAGGELVVRRGTLDQVSFLIDGMRARNPLDFEPYTNVNLTSVQELEIITGGFNAEYGDAQSGVFNIVTKDGTNELTLYSEARWMPAGKKHWGTAFYDYSTSRYWENTHARHLQWWIDNPNQWVDLNGTPGNDPNSIWTPEEAYADYMATHQPLTDYTSRDGYQTEISIGGPTPLKDLFFFVSGKYRTSPPITGNSFRSKGEWLDASLKFTYRLSRDVKLMVSSFYGESKSNVGMDYMNSEWVLSYGLENKYAVYDFPGYPINNTNGQTIQLTHVIDQNTFYQIQLSRIFRHREQSTFPGDEDGWELGVPQYDRIRAIDQFGNSIPEGFNNLIGLYTTGYYYRGRDRNSDITLSGDVTSQLTKFWQLKGGADFTYYTLDRFQEAKSYNAIENKVYNPYEGNVYFQNKLEFEGLIMNIGARYDFYNPNDVVYLNRFDPLDLYAAFLEGREPQPITEPTSTFGQLSPRIGISHPISENTVLHFSYGHFFQRATFGNYGEGLFVTGILNTFLTNPVLSNPAPYNLGNRALKPRKAVQYELGIEHNISGLVADVTAFYKDYSQEVRSIKVFLEGGGSYLTSGNSDYADAKGVEVSLRKPLSSLWGGYLNYSWSTGIYGRSGDPDVMAPPGSNIQVTRNIDIGDYISYDPARLKFGFTFLVPRSFDLLGGIFSEVQLSIDYQVYYPHPNISSDVFSESGSQFIRTANKNADFRLRKDFSIGFIKPAIFVEVRNLFNDKWTNLDVVKSASPEDRVNFVNSMFSEFPANKTNGAPFPDVVQYRNLPRQIILGVAITY